MKNSPIKPTQWTHWVALGFGSGLAPKAPGTFGTIAALPLVCLAHYFLVPLVYGLFCALLFGLAVYCAGRTQRDFSIHDPGCIVIDEWVGMAIALLFLPALLWIWCGAFVLFRAFDVLKPWPINVVDRHVKGGLGNVLDDVLAGALTCAVLQAYWHW